MGVSQPDADPAGTGDPRDTAPRARVRQWTAALIVNLAAVCGGTAVAWSAPTLPILQAEEKDVGEWVGTWPEMLLPSQPLTEHMGSLVAALVPLGALAGALPAGALVRVVGMRRPLLGLAGLFTLGWALILLARPGGVAMILVGRAVHGVATGASTVLVPRYSDEVSEVAIRGALGSLLDLSMCNGVLLVYVLALGVPYGLLTIVAAIVPFLFAASFFFMPESPVFLAKAGRRQEALEALAWLRPGWSAAALDVELATLAAEDVKEDADKPSTSAPPTPQPETPPKGCWAKMRGWRFSSTDAKGMFISYSLMFLQQAAAISAVIMYATQIFAKAGGALSPRVSTVLLGALESVGALAAALVVDRAGRRPLLVGSSLVVGVSLAALAFVTADAAPWLPPVALGFYIAAFAVGLGPLPWFIVAELVGPTAGGGAVALNWATASIVTELYPGMARQFGQRPVFGAFAVMAIVAVIFSLLLLPETRGKTRAELTEELRAWPRRAPRRATGVV